MPIVHQFAPSSHTPSPKVLLIAPPKPPIALLPARAESLRAREPAPEFRVRSDYFSKLSDSVRADLFAITKKVMVAAARYLVEGKDEMLMNLAVSQYDDALMRLKHNGDLTSPYMPRDVEELYREMGIKTAAEVDAYVEENFAQIAQMLIDTEREIAQRHLEDRLRTVRTVRKTGEA